MIKVWHLSTDDLNGGAARAAYRLHTALLQQGIESTMRVLTHQTANNRVIAGKGPRTFIQKVKNKLTQQTWAIRVRKFKTSNLIMHSFGHASAGIVDEINQSDADVVHLHWIINLLSIEDIGRITKPIVWTLHDMWAFCGGEHIVPDDDAKSRFRVGYMKDNRPLGEAGPDLNRFAWQRKQSAWAHQRFNIVTPGRWMARCARESVLFQQTPVQTIPNPLEMQHLWRPISKQYARAVLGLEQSKHYVLSGSAGGMPHLKGEDLLKEAMAHLVDGQTLKPELLIFGQYKPAGDSAWPCPVHWLGPVRDDYVMTLIYAAADVMAVPSRQDNLPNTAIEANACGVPVVAFNIGGLPDILIHQQNGWLAPAFDTQDLAKGIAWVLEDKARWQTLSTSARQHALERFSPAVITQQYVQVYQQAIERARVQI